MRSGGFFYIFALKYIEKIFISAIMLVEIFFGGSYGYILY